jgi:hypothetical protein
MILGLQEISTDADSSGEVDKVLVLPTTLVPGVLRNNHASCYDFAEVHKNQSRPDLLPYIIGLPAMKREKP